ncbi:hypothetical protein R1sor_005537 [Riccia sorocarpa]|uniref:Rhodopsin n=1 Tax=Riccia sorocarpa TaxID=122646 RepID=A0ABD3HP58_9MARC
MAYYDDGKQPPVGVPPPQGYGAPGYQQGYPPQGYPPQGYPPQGYAPQGYQPGYPQQQTMYPPPQGQGQYQDRRDNGPSFAEGWYVKLFCLGVKFILPHSVVAVYATCFSSGTT